jgi:hypothetical protein
MNIRFADGVHSVPEPAAGQRSMRDAYQNALGNIQSIRRDVDRLNFRYQGEPIVVDFTKRFEQAERRVYQLGEQLRSAGVAID